MRVLYKALASVGMIALSTAAALGVRYLAKRSKAQKEAREAQETINANNNNDDSIENDIVKEAHDELQDEADESSEDNHMAESDEMQADNSVKVDENDDLKDVVTAEVEIKKDIDDSAKEAE